MYQLLWIQNKPWHVYRKELQGGLFKVCVLSYKNLGSKPRGKFIRTVFQDVPGEQIAKNETKEHHKDGLVKAKYYLQSQEDPTKSVTHGKNCDEKYERNIHIIKIIIQAVLLCREQDS